MKRTEPFEINTCSAQRDKVADHLYDVSHTHNSVNGISINHIAKVIKRNR